MKNKIIGIIPARYNSTRFFGKLLYKIGSKTLLQHTYENAKLSLALDDLIIATEDENIFNEAKKFKAKCIMTNKCSNGTERIIDVLKNNNEIQDSSIIVNIQGDHPRIDKKTIDEVVNILKDDSFAKMSTAVTEIDYETAKSINCVKCVFDKNNYALYFSRSLIPFSKNEKNIKYYYHIGIYGYKTSFLYELASLKETSLQKNEDLEQLKVLENGYKIKVAIVDDAPVGVDVFEDVKKVEKILCQ
jgi:3-deoxy-manno-octulosonate cytidylyltransferase (CMP-KDO synthetase)